MFFGGMGAALLGCMLAEPVRPQTVPTEAMWSDTDSEWVVGERDAEGRLLGVVRYFRRDGTICCATEHVDGVPHGHFQRYHENGEVAREGTFVHGTLDGTNVFIRSIGPTTETFPTGLDERVWRAELDYRDGAIVAGRLYDRDGQPVGDGGAQMPERPAAVPAEAQHDGARGQWVHGQSDGEGRRAGTWRWWSGAGVLVEVTEYRAGQPHGRCTTYHDDGTPAEDFFCEDGQRHGLYRAWNGRGDLVAELGFSQGLREGPFRMQAARGDIAEERVAVLEGTFEGDQAVGPCRMLDADDALVMERDLGVYLDEQTLSESPVLADEARPRVYWERVCGALIGARRFGEAICAAARAVAAGADPKNLRALLSRCAVPRTAQGALAAFAQLRGEEKLVPFVHALVRGADPGHVLRHMAMLLDQRTLSRPAHAFVDTAIALEPERHEYRFTRALVRASLGWPAGARADVRALAETCPQEHAFLQQYLSALFPRFDFWPARVAVPRAGRDDVPEAPARSVEDVRLVVQKYATRLARVRTAIVARAGAGELSWMPPDVSSLLPEGPVSLDVFDGVDDAPFVDETLDLGSAEIPVLLRFARDDWAALCWLCWACGLDAVSLPGQMRARVDHRDAVAMMMERVWRCRDRLQTSGQVAESLGVASFTWEGIDVDALHPGVAQIAESEHAEVRAMFTWLGDANVASPWQRGLRA